MYSSSDTLLNYCYDNKCAMVMIMTLVQPLEGLQHMKR